MWLGLPVLPRWGRVCLPVKARGSGVRVVLVAQAQPVGVLVLLGVQPALLIVVPLVLPVDCFVPRWQHSRRLRLGLGRIGWLLVGVVLLVVQGCRYR